jgi:glycerate kinase
VGIAKRCRARNIPVAAIVGSMGENACKTYNYGIGSIMPAVNRDMSLDEAMPQSGELLTDAADRMFRFIKMGMNMSGTKRP